MRRGLASSLLAGALLLAPAVAQGAVQTPEPGSPIDTGAISNIHLERFGAGRDDSKGVR